MAEMIENWRPVKGCEDSYEVSDLGRVRSLDRIVQRRDGKQRRALGRLMAIQSNRSGHKVVRLKRNGCGRNRYVHQMVLEAFVGPRPAGMDACHNDGNPSNNVVSNLRWDTTSNNILDAVVHGTHPSTAKTHCPQGHEYTPENTRLISNGVGLGRRCIECARVRSKRSRARNCAVGLSRDDRRHGTSNGYTNFGCRCEACRAAKAQSRKLRRSA